MDAKKNPISTPNFASTAPDDISVAVAKVVNPGREIIDPSKTLKDFLNKNYGEKKAGRILEHRKAFNKGKFES